MKLWGILVGGVALSLAAPVHAAVHSVIAPLTVAQETPAPTGTTAATSGSADIDYDDVTNVLTYSITFTGLTGAPNAAHFHGPAARGATAVPVTGGTITDLTSPMTGTLTLTAGQETELLGGLWYVNIHTPTNSSGEIRGQIEFAAADAGTDAAPAEGGVDAAPGDAAPADAGDAAVSDASADASEPADAAAGGSGGSGGAATGGRGGATTGGSGGRGGATATGGRAATTGGTAGTAPIDAGAEGGDSEDDGGCGCSVPGSRTSSGALLASLALFGIASARRRRRS